MTPDLLANEERFVNTFVRKHRRERLLFELHKRRGDFLNRFCHGALDYLIPACVEVITNSNPGQILEMLMRRGTEMNCYAISASDVIDMRVLPLSEALDVAVGFGLPTILVCRPGQLVYLETEQIDGPPDRYILSFR